MSAKPGELSAEQSAVAKAILLAMGFGVLGIFVIAIEMYIQPPIVIYSIVVIGIVIIFLGEAKK